MKNQKKISSIMVAMVALAFRLDAQFIEIEKLVGQTNTIEFRDSSLWQCTDFHLLERDAATGELLQTIKVPGNFGRLFDMKIAPNGVFWFAAKDNGVVRFDGTDWQIFSFGNTPVFDDNFDFKYILAMPDGEIWASTVDWGGYAGPCYFYDGNAWSEVASPSSDYAEGFIETPDGGIVFCTNDTLMLKKKGSMDWVPIPEPAESGANYVANATFDQDGKLWVNAYTNSLGYYRYDNGLTSLPTFVMTGYHPYFIAFDPNNDIYIGTPELGLGHWDGNDWVFEQPAAKFISLDDMYVHYLKFAPDGKLWVANTFNGADFLTLWENGAAVKNLGAGAVEATILGSDRLGNMWFGGQSGLMSRQNISDGRFEYFEAVDSFQRSSAHFIAGKGAEMWYQGVEKIWYFDGNKWQVFDDLGVLFEEKLIDADSLGNVYFWSLDSINYDPLLGIYNSTDGTWDTDWFPQIEPTYNFFQLGELDESNNFWSLFQGSQFFNDLLVKRSFDGTIKTFEVPNTASTNRVYEIKTGKNGAVYLISWETAELLFFRLDAQNDTIVPMVLPNIVFEDQNSIPRLDVDPKGRIWISDYRFTTNGINAWLYENGIWKSLAGDYGEYLYFMSMASDGATMYFGFYDALGRFETIVGQVDGKILSDTNSDCSQNPTDEPKPNVLVHAKNGLKEYFGMTKNDGSYTIFSGSPNVEVAPIPPSNLWKVCAPATVSLTVNKDSTVHQDFLLQPVVFCPKMSVSLSTPFLRRCFDNNYYVKVCNNGTTEVIGAAVEIYLPQEMSFVSSAQPFTVLSPKTYRFELGNMAAGDCKNFVVKVNIDCSSTSIGQTLCLSAHVFPDEICDPTGPWEKATVLLDARCESDSIRFSLKNIGQTATSTPIPYLLLKNGQVVENGNWAIQPGQSASISVPRSPETWRLMAAQESGHPFATAMPSLAIEGCTNGGGAFDKGHVLSLPNGDGSDFSTRDCQGLIGSFDPNDKTAQPTGAGPDNRIIAPGTRLDYRVRFQNTGTDTAFTVVVRDTLAAGLDISSLEFGASSHPFEVDLRDRALAFIFNNILLPDSNINAAASHGFLNYSIQPRTDLPLGTDILNRAHIYFDFNEAVATNETWHTVDQVFDIVDVENPVFDKKSGFQIFPNPNDGHFLARANFGGSGVFEMFDGHGNFIERKTAEADAATVFYCEKCGSGIHWLRFTDSQNGAATVQKIVVMDR